ncbi:MAG: hypothetical protein KAX65_11060 [Caldilineaceae bacterium]|nr:hypothetical protein [Caldilineaceae bacterium]
MSDLHHERFDLSRFVLDFLEQQGSVVAPPAFGVYEVLMPEELAADLGVDDFQHLRFDGEPAPGAPDATLQLSVNHPLVDTIAAQVATQPASAAVYVNQVRLEKRGLVELARKIFGFPNARLDFVPQTQERSELHHYLQFNFKVTILSEEKQEDLASVVMDVQAGYAVTDPAQLRALSVYDTETTFDGFPLAPPRWIGAGDALAVETLAALLPRAATAARGSLAERLTGLAARMEHHLLLDLARIEVYYTELELDLHKRQARVESGDTARRQEFDDKLAMLERERRTKIEDARARYALRVELELVNTLLITQPKVTIPVSIGNRTATIRRTVVWDPLMHRLEPLVCDVCGEPGEGLHLCTGGHLAHATCLAPQCVDCKRVYCQMCASQINACVVCQRPVCRQSLITCSTCGRGTCREHQGLCHAADGQPVVLTAPPAATPPPPAQKSPAASSAAQPVGKPAQKEKPKPPVVKQAPPKPPAAAPVVTGERIDVQIYEDRPLVMAFVMRSSKRVLASRAIELTPKGINVTCECEKSPCPAHGYYHFPRSAAFIAEQVEELLRALQKEYLVPAKRVNYFVMRDGDIVKLRALELPPLWTDPQRLAEAVRGFNALR